MNRHPVPPPEFNERRSLVVPLFLWKAGTAALILFASLSAWNLSAAASGADVVVIYNSKVAASKMVAEHYASRRGVPAAQVLGFDLPTEETISRKEYLDRLEKPLVRRLEELKLFTFGPATNKTEGRDPFRRLLDARVRYAAVCFGVPVRIPRDDSLVEPGTDQLPPEARRNEAAVDAQLALTPRVEEGVQWAGAIPNHVFLATNVALLHPTNGVLLVGRLDGPTAAIARGLVDKALEAETNGLWGRAYFDARGLPTNDVYYRGDVVMRASAEAIRRAGWEVVLDDTPATFSAGYLMSQIAVYAGWYDTQVSGPFTLPAVEFQPGAFAYHLYSFNASTIRSTNSWVGMLLDKGATCTMGSVDEPYLTGTPEISVFLNRLFFRAFTFGEAAYAAQSSLSWQTTVIGDPLYCPFGRSPDTVMAELEKRQSGLLEWYYLTAINQRLVGGARPAEAIQVLESFPGVRKSAVLTEKLADLYWAKGALTDAVYTYEAALKRQPSPVQRMRLLLTAAEKRGVAGPDETAIEHYRTFLKENPDYPERLRIYQQMLPIAKRRNMTTELANIESEIKKLNPSGQTKP
jgi:uncharacterized protein (TIGR03790 family)